jgi:hypothetical protein
MPAASDNALPAWAARAIDELHASDRQATAVALGLDAEQLNQPPAPGSWSVGQCLEHLYIANEVYLPPMTRALLPSTGSGHGGPSPSRVEHITPGWFGRYFIRTYIDPTTQKARAKAPGKIRPAPRVDTDILARFLRSNDAARDLVRHASAFDVNRIRFKNPFVAGIRFTVGTGIEIIWRHQRRHLLQAERARAGIGLSSAR